MGLGQLIERTTIEGPITVVVGAGSSVESGLPDWPSLVDDLLHIVGEQHGLKGSELDAFCRWTSQRDQLTGAGAIVKSELGKDFVPTLRSVLYGDASRFAPGPTAIAAARLRLAFPGRRSEITTLNYDVLLEQALRNEFDQQAKRKKLHIRSLVDNRTQVGRELVVRHVHGLVRPTGGSEGNVVLSEGDYHLMQDERSWQGRYFRERLSNSTCVFVGTSLTDPNLLRYLYRTAESRGHLAVFARQQDAPLYEDARPRLVQAREQTAEKRWDGVGIKPFVVDHYSQSAQVLFELALKRTAGDLYRPYDDRLADWDAQIRRSVLSTRGRFAIRQDELQEILAESVRAARDTLEGEGVHPRKRERLQMSLWAHRPKNGTLVNWVSSDRAWRDPATLEPVSITWESQFASVRAFCNGSVVSYSTTEQAATRWNHVVAAPVYLDRDEEFGRLPVGVVTLASTLPAPRSSLARGLSTVRTTIVPSLTERAAELLRPR